MKHWFWEHFLPMWAKETLLQDNRQLRRQIRQLRQENEVLLWYIKGMEKGLRVGYRNRRAKGGSFDSASSMLCSG